MTLALQKLWRCLIVCKAIPSNQEKVLKISLVTLCLVSLGVSYLNSSLHSIEPQSNVGCGIAYISSAGNFLTEYMLVFTSVSAFINAVFTTIIVIRLSSHKRYIKSVLGSPHKEEFYESSPFDSNQRMYTRLINICVESAALIVVFNAVHVGLVAATQNRIPNQSLPIPHHLLVHIYVSFEMLPLFAEISFWWLWCVFQGISTMLILHRVARGKWCDVDLCAREVVLPIQLQSRNDNEDSWEARSGSNCIR